jgi:hypothetical protein
LDDIEKKLDIKFLERNLDRSLKKIAISYNDDPETQVNTIIIEKYVENGRLPTNKKDINLINKVIKKTFDESVSLGVNFLNQNRSKTLEDMHRYKIEFESRLRKRWKEPLDLLELLINSSMELGEKIKKQLSTGKVKISNPKHMALIKVHARAIQVANEIFSLLESGYADGANGRWRTLYELTAIFLILKDNADSLSEKYLEYQAIKAFKDVNDYQNYYRILGYRSLPKKKNHSIY